MVEQIEDRAEVGAASSPLVGPPAGTRSESGLHVLNLLLILLLVAGFFWRVVFFGETLVDVATLNNQIPWGYDAGPSDYPYNRRDLTDTYITREYFVLSAYRGGELPLWNPYTMAGHPIYADGVTRILSPFVLLNHILGVPVGYSLARVLEVLLAAVLMYAYLISIGVSPRGALLGSLPFVFSAHSMLHLTHLGWWGALMWLPLILLLVDKAVTRSSYFFAAIAGIAFGVQFFFSFIPAQIYYPLAIALYYLFFGRLAGGGPAGKRRLTVSRAFGMLAVTLVIGFGLAATQWAPTLELLQHSNRRIVGEGLGYIYLPPWYLLTLVFPNLFGGAFDPQTLTLFTALNVSHDHILYIGIAALAPLGYSLYSVLNRRVRTSAGANTASESHAGSFSLDETGRDRLKLLLIIGAAGLLLMMAAPLYVPLTKYVPLLRVIRVAVRAWVLLIFPVSALIGIGTDLLLNASKDRLTAGARVARFAFIGGGIFVGVSTTVAYLIRGTSFVSDLDGSGAQVFIRKSANVLSRQFMPPDSALLIPLVFGGALALLLAGFASGRVTARTFYAALAVLLITDLYWYGRYFNPTYDSSRVFPETRITTFLKAQPPGRVVIAPSAILTNRRVSGDTGKIIAPPNTLLAYRIPTVTGKNQQFPKWYQEYASLIEPQHHPSHVVFENGQSRYLNALNVRYLLTYSTRLAPAGFEHLMTAEGIAVYENRDALPRAFFAIDIKEVNSDAEGLATLADPAFDPRRTVVLATGGSVEDKRGSGGNMDFEGEAEILEDGLNRVVIETSRNEGGVLVLSDNYYPGWRAYIDGSPVQILRANHTMRAVHVPAGQHVVTFRFAPAMFVRSVYISLSATVLTAIVLIVLFVRERTRGSEEVGYDLRKTKADR